MLLRARSRLARADTFNLADDAPGAFRSPSLLPQAAELAAAAVVEQSAEVVRKAGKPDAVLFLLLDSTKRNVLKEPRSKKPRSKEPRSAAPGAAGGDDASDDEGQETEDEADEADEEDEEDDALLAGEAEAPGAAEEDPFLPLAIHHVLRLVERRAYGDGVRVFECFGDGENGVAAFLTQCRRGEGLGVSRDSDLAVYHWASASNLQAALSWADPTRPQAWDGRLALTAACGPDVTQLGAYGMMGLNGDYIKFYVRKDGQHGPKKCVSLALEAARTVLKKLTGAPEKPLSLLLHVASEYVDTLVQQLRASGLVLCHKGGEPFPEDEQLPRLRGPIASQLLRPSIAFDSATAKALADGTPVAFKSAGLASVFLSPLISRDAAAEWHDQVLPAADVLHELQKPQYAPLLRALDYFHGAHGGLVAEEKQLRDRGYLPLPLAGGPAVSRTLAELRDTVPAVAPAAVFDALGPERSELAQVRGPYTLAAGVLGRRPYPSMSMPGVEDGETVWRVAYRETASVSGVAKSVARLCAYFTPAGVPQRTIGPDCFARIFKRATVHIDAEYANRDVLVLADYRTKTLLVISPVKGVRGVHLVLYHKSFAAMLLSRQLIQKHLVAPECAAARFLLSGGALRKHPRLFDTPPRKGVPSTAVELNKELRRQALPNLERVLATGGREGWPALDAPPSSDDEWAAAAAPVPGAGTPQLRAVGSLMVHLPPGASQAAAAAANAALAAERRRRRDVAADEAQEAAARATVTVAAAPAQFGMLRNELQAATSAKRFRGEMDEYDDGTTAIQNAKRLHAEGRTVEATAVVQAALARLNGTPDVAQG